MSSIEQQIVQWCRGQLRVPWGHQGRAPGEVLDCVGLPVCALRAFGLPVVDMLEYSERPSPAELIAHVERNCVRVDGPGPARLGLFCMIDPHLGPTHSGVFTGDGTFIHATRGRGDGQVTEVRLTRSWLTRVHSFWEFPFARCAHG